MSSSDITSLKRSLSGFITDIRKHYRDDHEVDEATTERLERRYRVLYEQYRVLDEDTINREFSSDHIKAISFLSLGQQQAGQFYRDLAPYFSEHADRTAVAVAHFVKSRRAYDLVNKTTRSQTDNEALARMFGSMLGVRVSENFVASLRAEEMGRIVGYALSGLCENDMKAWNDAKTGRALRKQHTSLDQYLHHTIRNADKWASYRFENQLEASGAYVAAIKINEFEGAPEDKARGRNVVDHCFVRHGPGGKGVITLGTSTAKTQAQAHGYSFAQPTLAAKAMVRMKKINGEDNPYFGYDVQTYCFFSGHMPTTNLDGTPARSPLVKMLETDRPGTQGKITRQQIKLLAQMPFFSLFASTNPSPVVGRGLESINPMVAGCDTFDLYEKQVDEHRQKAIYSTSRKLAVMVMGYVSKVAGLLAQDNTYIALDADGPQRSLQPILEVLLRISNNHFKNFPVKDNQSLSRQESDFIQRAGVAFGKIAEKIRANKNNLRGDLAGAFEEEADRLTDPSLLAKRIERDSLWGSQLDRPTVFGERLYSAIDSLRNYDSGLHLDNMVASLKGKIVAGNALALFEKVFVQVDQQLNDANSSDKSDRFWEDYKSCLRHALADGENRTWQGVHHDNWSALRNERLAFLAEFRDHPGAKIVNATIALIGQKSPTGGLPLSDRIEYNAVDKALVKTCKAMVGLARTVVSDDLTAELRALGDLPKSKKGFRC